MMGATAMVAAIPATTMATAPVETVSYVVRAGDALDRLQRAYLLPGHHWRRLARLARVRNPRRLPVGTVLSVPREWLRYTVEPARLVSFRGTVRVTGGSAPAAVSAGMPIDERMVIETAANSFATLILADRSKVTLPSQSRATVTYIRRILLTGAIDYRIDIARGRLETKVTPLTEPAGRYRVSTPISMTAVRGTEFRVSYDPEANAAAAEVLAGVVAVSGNDVGGDEGAIAVEKGRGAVVAGGAPPRAVTLLAAPTLLDPGALQREEQVGFTLTPVAGAVRYRVVLARDAGFVDNLAEAIGPGPRLTLTDIPNGRLFVRTSAIDAAGVEGLAESYSFARQLASIHGGAADPDGDGFRFRWFGAGDGTRRYRFQLRRGDPKASPLVDQVGLTSDTLVVRRLPGGVYYWRVGVGQVDKGEEVEAWSDPEKLTITEPKRRR